MIQSAHTNHANLNRATAPGSIHTLGDGYHHLPAHQITGQGIRPLTSEPCILLLFVLWAQRSGYDPVAIHERAYPQEVMLRPDALLMFRQWTHCPDKTSDRTGIDLKLLKHDLTDVNQHELVKAIEEIESGRHAPPKAFSHWVVDEHGRIGGEARDLDPPDTPDDQGQHYCFVRLFAMPDLAEWGYTNATNLQRKNL